jgi:xylose isomerase
MKYVTRINSFLRTGITVAQALELIGKIDGVDYVDLNYPEHFKDYSVEQMKELLERNNLKLNAINTRFRDRYLNGVFDNPDEEIRKEAIDLSLEADDVCYRLGGLQTILWLPTDGYDYSFQIDYVRTWEHIVEAFREICAKAKCKVSNEYKPYEERVHCYMDCWSTSYMLMKAVDSENFGITLDFCHMLMKKENPALAASILLKENKLFCIHVNDGEGSTDDGLMVGSVNFWKTLELFYYLKKYDYQGTMYFDTFPKREEAVAECEMNLRMCRKMEELVDRLGVDYIGSVIDKQDGTAVMKMFLEII